MKLETKEKLSNISDELTFAEANELIVELYARELDGGNIGEQGPLGREGVKIWIK